MLIETKRLLIRKMIPEDWEGVRSVAETFKHGAYVLYDHKLPDDDDGYRALTRRFSDSDTVYSVFHRDDDALIGYVCMYRNPHMCEMGYCFHSAYHRSGYAFEACSALIEAMEQNGIDAFVSGTALDNIPSVRLLEKLGFGLIGLDTMSFHQDEQGNDIVFRSGIFLKAK